MKRLLLPLIILLLAACQREAEMPEATSAAKEVYMQYADRKDLTVAMIGDYQGYNAVMLQAQDAEGWLRLCEEFGVGKRVDATALDSTRVSSLTIGKVRSVDGDNLQALKDLLGDDSVMLGNILSNTPAKVRIDTSFSITHREHWNHGVLVDSSTSTAADNPQKEVDLMQRAIVHGHNGYIVRDDSDMLTLWLFFYSTEDEKNQILNTTVQ
ncbi:MAG: hypothetical protein IJQ14_04020 [Bacteroidales bacterium]|nr:hypothetical protein [Bacteroidales bacterium]